MMSYNRWGTMMEWNWCVLFSASMSLIFWRSWTVHIDYPCDFFHHATKWKPKLPHCSYMGNLEAATGKSSPENLSGNFQCSKSFTLIYVSLSLPLFFFPSKLFFEAVGESTTRLSSTHKWNQTSLAQHSRVLIRSLNKRREKQTPVYSIIKHCTSLTQFDTFTVQILDS